jgi:hypothetical protein
MSKKDIVIDIDIKDKLDNNHVINIYNDTEEFIDEEAEYLKNIDIIQHNILVRQEYEDTGIYSNRKKLWESSKFSMEDRQDEIIFIFFENTITHSNQRNLLLKKFGSAKILFEKIVFYFDTFAYLCKNKQELHNWASASMLKIYNTQPFKIISTIDIKILDNFNNVPDFVDIVVPNEYLKHTDTNANAFSTMLVGSNVGLIYDPQQISYIALTLQHLVKNKSCGPNSYITPEIANDVLKFVNALAIRHKAFNTSKQLIEKIITYIDKNCYEKKNMPGDFNYDINLFFDNAKSITELLNEGYDTYSLLKDTSRFCGLLNNKTIRLGKKLAEGVEGEVYELFIDEYKLDKKVVVKTFKLAVPDKFHDMLREIQISSILSSLGIDGVLKTYGFFMCNAKIYLIMERADGTLNDLYEHIVPPETLVFQILYTLYVLQKTYKFTHYDLHWQNIMYVEVPKKDVEYIVGNKKYKMNNNGMQIKIMDYGLSRLEVGGKVIAKYDAEYSAEYGISDQYNPTYDLLYTTSHYFKTIKHKIEHDAVPTPIYAGIYKPRILNNPGYDAHQLIENIGIYNKYIISENEIEPEFLKIKNSLEKNDILKI